MDTKELARTVERESGLYRLAAKLYASLGGPWSMPTHMANGTQSGLLNDLLALEAQNAPEGAFVRDYGKAQWLRQLLLDGRFLTTRFYDGERGTKMVEYEKASELPEPDRRTWQERMNDELRRQQAAERRMRDEEAQNALRLAEQQAEFASAAEQNGFNRALKRALGPETTDLLVNLPQRMAALEESISRLAVLVSELHLGSVTNDAPNDDHASSEGASRRPFWSRKEGN